ncbi:hypothetical protein ABR737_28935 [Streptomyces sp. Edi2]|uniref:hypothetical protein n=1 Tax=Streptomyces sp. Edi2 TaxID=3162528 RepID=UPI003306108E
MSSAGPEPRADAVGLLAATEGLRVRARAQMNGSWVSLLGFSLLALAAVPVARYAFNFGAHGRSIGSYPTFAYAELTGLCVVHEPGTPCLRGEFDGAVLRFAAWGVWFALLPLAWFVFARWYRLRGEARGIVPRRGVWIRTTAIATATITAALMALLFSRHQSWDAELLENSYASPWYLVGIGLLALGMAERSWIAAAAGAAHAVLLTGYLGASWGSGWLPWQHPAAPNGTADPGWTDGPQAKACLLAAILLLAGLAEWAVARRRAASGAAPAGTAAS